MTNALMELYDKLSAVEKQAASIDVRLDQVQPRGAGATNVAALVRELKLWERKLNRDDQWKSRDRSS